MSWLFGKKKHRESPPETPSEPPPPDDSFIFIEKRNDPMPGPYSGPPSLYPSIERMSLYPGGPLHMPSLPHLQKQPSQDSQPFINLIQFKLCKQLQRSQNQDFDIDKLRVDEIEMFLNRIKAENYDYDFQLERSIINEMNSQILE